MNVCEELREENKINNTVVVPSCSPWRHCSQEGLEQQWVLSAGTRLVVVGASPT